MEELAVYSEAPSSSQTLTGGLSILRCAVQRGVLFDECALGYGMGNEGCLERLIT